MDRKYYLYQNKRRHVCTPNKKSTTMYRERAKYTRAAVCVGDKNVINIASRSFKKTLEVKLF